jgi:hypothetical protein
MNTKYYTSFNLENNQYVGKVFLSSTNQLVYTTKAYNSQEQAISDARTYVITEAPPVTDPNPPKSITNTTTYSTPRPVHGYTKKCCGR